MATVNQTITSLKSAIGNINSVVETLENGLPTVTEEVEVKVPECSLCDGGTSNSNAIDCNHNWHVSFLPMTQVLIIRCSNCHLYIEDDALTEALKNTLLVSV